MTHNARSRFSRTWAGTLTRILGFMTAGDAAIIGIVVAAALVLFLVLPAQVLSSGTMVEIRSADRLVGKFPLDRDRVVEVTGRLGTTVIKIAGGRASIESSPCPKGICTHMKEIGSGGGVLACVPNQVVVHVCAGNDDGLDGVTR